MTRMLSFAVAGLAALALLGAAPAFAGNGHGHGYGWGHGRGGYRGGYYYPRPGYVAPYLPPRYVTVTRWGAPYYYGAGAWYRPYGPSFVVVGAPLGVVVPYLPPFYSTVWVGGAPYYCAGGAYYQAVPGGYAVVAPPPNLPPQPAPYSPAGTDDAEIYAYPGRGQSASRQDDDRYTCHRWAVDQTGFDPTRALEGVDSGGSRSAYQRAMAACLEARGYAVR